MVSSSRKIFGRHQRENEIEDREMIVVIDKMIQCDKKREIECDKKKEI